MRVLRSARWLWLAILVLLIPVSSRAGVFISVGFAPPVLPVYVQPECPEPGLIWTPGYWAYGEDGYYWVPGTWVPAPYEGALWTPPYWGWDTGLYVFHPGYWGHHVGYYGGVNYGFGYMGVGFVGGEWRGHDFAYNTAVMRVNRTVIRNTYVNETIVHNTTIVNNHIAYSGGPGGIRHEPTPEERVALRESHAAPTPIQQQHFQAARLDHAAYFKANNGHPQNVVAPRPLAPQHVQGPGVRQENFGSAPRPVMGANGQNGGRPAPTVQPQNRPSPVFQNRAAQPGYQPQNRPGTAPGVQPQNRPNPVYQNRPMQQGYQPQERPAPQQPGRPAPNYQQAQPQYRPQERPAPQQPSRPAPNYQQAQPQYRPQERPQYQPQSRPDPSARPAPAPRAEPQSRPAPQPRPEPRPHESHR